MAKASSSSRTRIEWLWKSNKDPWSSTEPEEWSVFSDVEIAIIEDGFQRKLSEVLLDSYHIDFQRSVQISNVNANQQRPVKRIDKTRSTAEVRLREARFMPNPINPSTPFTAQTNLLMFFGEFYKHYDITNDQNLNDPNTIRMLIEKAAEGIIIEGKLVGKQKEAEWIAEQLLKMKDANQDEIWQCCAHIYTMESFLYQKMNEYMRLAGDKQHEELWKSKILTFGPFAFLLSALKTTKKYSKMTVYRGANLSDDLISKYRDNLDAYLTFPAFTSTSRNRAKAEQFGNVLFAINISTLDGADVSSYSAYPDEEETLLSFDFAFYIRSCNFDANRNKWVIELSP
ncbi:unnamed protein product [Rotaria socialis]|uniref:NAD(P)(+)--arginine ADP-ribosyltransferase n=1 Tax=Rotaria socialis TaxID=392032 RepID=A0A817Q8J5_9BILA|nr:unnamed protein product [Rotaria socialis]